MDHTKPTRSGSTYTVPMLSQKEHLQRKRERDQSVGEENESRLNAKRQKTTSNNYPPHVWNNLSKITLTRKALREFDRRTRDNKSPQVARFEETAPRLLRSDTRRLEHFASNGGPDLSKLRGYAELPTAEIIMDKSNSRTSKRQRDSGLPGTSFTTKSGTTGPYDPQFEQLLIDSGVYPKGYRMADGSRPPNPDNLEDIRRRLGQARPSLSPSAFSETAFETFQDRNEQATSEQKVMMDVIPTITGRTGTQYHNAGNIEFNNLAEFAPGISTAKPDGYDGARPSDIDRRVRSDLNSYIIPSTANHLPAAPNNFSEVKGQSGRLDVLQRQAMYAGAIGARSSFELQNYGNETLVYDGNAYTTVSAYHAGNGTLQMYATHPRHSEAGQTEYYMTQLDTYAMTGNINNFRQGAAALRNARDFSKEERDRFIASANTTARGQPAVATPSSATGSRGLVSSRTEGTSFDSETSTDELAPGYEDSPKRQRKGNAVTPRRSGSAYNHAKQPQRASYSTPSSASRPPHTSSQERYVWLGYSFKPLQDGTYEFKCTIGGRSQTLVAKWIPGQTYPQVFDKKEDEWLQSSPERQFLRLFVRGRYITLGKQT